MHENIHQQRVFGCMYPPYTGKLHMHACSIHVTVVTFKCAYWGRAKRVPLLVCNVEILSVRPGPARYLFFVLMTLYQLLCELLRMGKIACYTRQQSSDKTQRLLRPQARLQQVRAAHMGTFRAGGHSNLAAHKQLFTVNDSWTGLIFVFCTHDPLHKSPLQLHESSFCSNTPNELNC